MMRLSRYAETRRKVNRPRRETERALLLATARLIYQVPRAITFHLAHKPANFVSTCEQKTQQIAPL